MNQVTSRKHVAEQVQASTYAAADTTVGFGGVLREWRTRRRMSQLHLALEADVSSRHISFLETGRSKPSREMVLHLCEVLEVPLRQRNLMLRSAGYADAFRESPLHDPALEPILRSVGTFLERQHPWPAILMDSYWDQLQANRGATALLTHFVDEPQPGFENVLRLFFHPKGLRPFVVNWREAGSLLVQRLRREVVTQGEDPRMKALLEEVLTGDDTPREWRMAAIEADLPVVLPIHLRKGDVELRLYTALTSLGTALDVTLNELRIETFLPVDDATERALARLGK